MSSRAGPGGGVRPGDISWSDLLTYMSTGYDTLMQWVARLLMWFNTPFEDMIDSDIGVTSWVTSIIGDVLELFGINFLNLTPLEFAMGSVIPVIIIFTIFRYIKQ